MGAFAVEEVRPEGIPEIVPLAAQLWGPEDLAGLAEDLLTGIASGGALFCVRSGGTAVGFAQCSLRRDYVEGTKSSPVGYLEGIFVSEDFRRRGAARLLLDACRRWAREQGCREFASDCESDNDISRAFHLKMGFREANRIICFTQKL